MFGSSKKNVSTLGMGGGGGGGGEGGRGGAGSIWPDRPFRGCLDCETPELTRILLLYTGRRGRGNLRA